VRRADNLSTFVYRLSWNLGALTSWNHEGSLYLSTKSLTLPSTGPIYWWRLGESPKCSVLKLVCICVSKGGVTLHVTQYTPMFRSSCVEHTVLWSSLNNVAFLSCLYSVLFGWLCTSVTSRGKERRSVCRLRFERGWPSLKTCA